MKYLLTVLTGAMLWACNQARVTGIEIDPAIQQEAEKKFTAIKGSDQSNVKHLFYENPVAFEFFEDDSLVLSSEGQFIEQQFKSFYLWKNDTLLIDGSIGWFGGGGFAIEVVNNKATVYHMLSADDFPVYAYGENTDLLYRLQVPCTDVKAVISELPEKGKNRLIYGYVEFKSGDYYLEANINEDKAPRRKKSRSNMKMYFKSAEFNPLP